MDFNTKGQVLHGLLDPGSLGAAEKPLWNNTFEVT